MKNPKKFPKNKKCADCGTTEGIAMKYDKDILLCGPCFRKRGDQGWIWK